MPNPTTAKPTGYFAEWDNTTGTVGAAMQCLVPLLGTGNVRDVVGNVLGEPHTGPNGHGLGHPPTLVPSGFTAGSLSDPTYRFGAGTTAIRFVNRGWAGTPTNPRTIWCVFKAYSTVGINRVIPIWGHNSDSQFSGIGISVSIGGTVTLGEHRAGAVTSTSTPTTITPGKWYLVAITYTGTTSRLLQVYCYDDQAYVTPQSTGSTFTGTAYFNGSSFPDAALNPGASYDGSGGTSFIGEVYACGLTNDTMDPATNSYFAALIADPCVSARGTYSGGGALSAGGLVNWDATTTSITVHSNRPSGGNPASYQYALHRKTTPWNASPTDSSTRVVGLQSNPVLVDTTALPGVTYYYKVEQTDGTSTAYTTTAATNRTETAARLNKGDFIFGVISDSRYAGTTAPRELAATLRARGYRTGFINCAVGSTAVYNSAVATLSWQPNTTQDPINGQSGTTLLANATSAFDAAGNLTHVYCALGVNDSAGNSPTTFGTKYGYLTNYVTGRGYNVVLNYPYLSMASGEAATKTVVDYQSVIGAMDNGGTIRVSGLDSYELSATGIESLTRDVLHYAYSDLEGIAAANAIYDHILDPLPTPASIAAAMWDNTLSPNRTLTS